MTTIFVDYESRLAITDSRMTQIWSRTLPFNLLQWDVQEEYIVCLQKAAYLHDRLFVSAGDVSAIDCLFNHLAYGFPFCPKKGREFTAMLIDKNWYILYSYKKDRLKKTFRIPDKSTWIGFGSGANYLQEELNQTDKWEAHKIIAAFKRVCYKDKNTDDNLNIYRI